MGPAGKAIGESYAEASADPTAENISKAVGHTAAGLAVAVGGVQSARMLKAPAKTPKPDAETEANPCFVKGTPVATSEGYRPIEEIGQGDSVWSYDHKSNSWTLQQVSRPLKHDYAGDVVTIYVADEKTESTGNHPFWVVSGDGLYYRPVPDDIFFCEPETDEGRWTEARDLKAGDRVLLLSGETAEITETETRTASITVYNLSVDNLHNYAVSLKGILVHNKSDVYDPSKNVRNGITVEDPSGKVAKKLGDAPKVGVPSGYKTVAELRKARQVHGIDPRKSAKLEQLTDKEMIQAFKNPRTGELVELNETNGIVQGHHRIKELVRRADSPVSSITDETFVRVGIYKRDLSMFWDIE